jgi:hypothetical protein
MNAEQLEQRSIHISQEKLLAFVGAVFGASAGRDSDEHPSPPDRYASLVREALDRIPINSPHWTTFDPNRSHRRTRPSEFGPEPQPAWKVVLTSLFEKYPELYDLIPRAGQKIGEAVSLNPQPLPPRIAFLAAVAHTVINRVELLHDVAIAIANEGESRSIIIVGGYLSRFCDDFCGNGFVLVWPHPEPRPWWFPTELTAMDLVAMASQFHQAAKEAFSPELGQHFADAAARLAEAGLSKLQ